VPKNQNTSDDEKPIINKQPRLLAFLAASAAFGDSAEPTLREQLLANLVILAHHPEICECFATYHKSGEVIVLQVETPGKFGLTCATGRV
jgi:hypothetical protein